MRSLSDYALIFAAISATAGCGSDPSQSSPSPSASSSPTLTQTFTCQVSSACPNSQTYIIEYQMNSYSNGTTSISCEQTGGTCIGITITCPQSQPNFLSVNTGANNIVNYTLGDTYNGCHTQTF